MQIDAVKAAAVAERWLGDLHQHFAPLVGGNGATADVAVEFSIGHRRAVAAGIGGLQIDAKLLSAAGAAVHVQSDGRIGDRGIIHIDVGHADGIEVIAGEGDGSGARLHRRRVGEIRRRRAEGVVGKAALQGVAEDRNRLGRQEPGERQTQQREHKANGHRTLLSRRHGHRHRRSPRSADRIAPFSVR